MSAQSRTAPPPWLHPLHPPMAAEIEAGADLLRPSLAAGAAFSNVALVEPDKHSVRTWTPDSAGPDRRLRYCGYDGGANPPASFDATVNLTRGEVERFEHLSVGHAAINFADIVTVIGLTKADPDWQAAARARGVTDFERVQIDPWPTGGYLHPSIPAGHRAMRAIAFLRTDRTDNGYARPLHGLIAHIDLTERRVAHVEDHGAVPLPPESGRYDAASQPSLRAAPAPLEITQPAGPGFEVDGYAISWENWQLRISMHPVHGLVLHQVGYNDNGELRPILYRAALADMVVPYGDTDPMHNWKHVFDASEAGIGTIPNSLTLGCDCKGEIHYFDVDVVNWEGKARTIRQAVCMHEEDYGILWKHYDAHSQTQEVRRSRRLVISAIHTVGNYEYGFFWYLYLDGTLQLEVKLTGIVGVSAVADHAEVRPEMAPLIAPNLTSPVHQHLFCCRLDFEVDGCGNSLLETEAQPLPRGPDNPHGTAFAMVAQPLGDEASARRQINPQRARSWKVVNPNRHNRLGNPVGYRLLPGATPTLLADADSPVGRRAGFARYNLWATPYAPDELSAAGDHTNLHPGGAGLPSFTAGNRRIDNSDLVLWHTFGLTHNPRPEDWPVMPCEYCGFHLLPTGFFDRNPAINLPPEAHCPSADAHTKEQS